MKVDLSFDVDTLRISDLGEDEQDGYTSANKSGSSVLDALKRNPTTAAPSGAMNSDPDDGAPVKKIKAETDSTKLRQFLNNLGED
jgi:hypothetical protein